MLLQNDNLSYIVFQRVIPKTEIPTAIFDVTTDVLFRLLMFY